MLEKSAYDDSEFSKPKGGSSLNHGFHYDLEDPQHVYGRLDQGGLDSPELSLALEKEFEWLGTEKSLREFRETRGLDFDAPEYVKLREDLLIQVNGELLDELSLNPEQEAFLEGLNAYESYNFLKDYEFFLSTLQARFEARDIDQEDYEELVGLVDSNLLGRLDQRIAENFLEELRHKTLRFDLPFLHKEQVNYVRRMIADRHQAFRASNWLSERVNLMKEAGSALDAGEIVFGEYIDLYQMIAPVNEIKSALEDLRAASSALSQLDDVT